MTIKCSKVTHAYANVCLNELQVNYLNCFRVHGNLSKLSRLVMHVVKILIDHYTPNNTVIKRKPQKEKNYHLSSNNQRLCRCPPNT